MLPGMRRLLVLPLLIACGNGSKSPAEQQKTPAEGQSTEKIAVPGAAVGAAEGTKGAVAPSTDDTAQAMASANDPRFHLKPEEGAITIDKAQGKAGAEAIAALKLAPATGWKVATDYPIKLQLEAPAGVTLTKAELTAGGRNKSQGDAATLTEQALAFDIKATAEKAGSYEIKGVFKFGICEKESCHPKKQPVTITVAAN
jgi:hypothetical protein